MSALHPKSVINKKYGSRAQYITTEVVGAEENAQQPRQNKYQCCLKIDEISVTSDVFTRKKDAEQHAAKLPLEKMGIQPSKDATTKKQDGKNCHNLTEKEKWKALKDRLCTAFSEKFLLSTCPLIAHFTAAVQRKGVNYGKVPAAVLSVFDNKIVSLCKSINKNVEKDPALGLQLVLGAAKSCSLLDSPPDSLWIGKKEPFSEETKEKLVKKFTGNENDAMEIESCSFEAVYIPCSFEKSVESLTMEISPQEYFMDVMAYHLGVGDSSHILISRTPKKAPSESRLYFRVPDCLPLVLDLNGCPLDGKKHSAFQLEYNTMASSLVGQNIHGDAILASVGSTWWSLGALSWENFSLSNYSSVKIRNKEGDVITEFASEYSYRKKNDAIQSAALKALHFIGATFGSDPVSAEKGGHLSMIDLKKEFSSLELPFAALFISDNAFGTIAIISYRVCLLNESVSECLEWKENFEFEFGTGAVIPQLEACIAHLSINESKTFHTSLPSMNEILAVAGENDRKISHLSSGASLEFTIKLLKLQEPPEQRMERALFSPPLSKQRTGYALRLLTENHAKSLVDLGCGSGSLFNALLDEETDLIRIVGVDISQKYLFRGAKVLHKKLGMDGTSGSPTSSIQSAELYNGSITEYDPRFLGFDVATCIEVIEHMEEDQASEFGECVLGELRPRVLMISTPNYNYNPILQNMALEQNIDCEGEKSELGAQGKVDASSKFRDEDHKFEWTEKEFCAWAQNLAKDYGYTVQIDGVGDTGEVPGFATQIAVFKRCHQNAVSGKKSKRRHDEVSYKDVWKWNADQRAREN